MSIDNLIFIDNLPKIDLHSLDRDTARVYINDFVNDNIKMKNEFVVIVHGNGSGILRKVTFEELRKNKKVIEYKTFYNNTGCTIARIKN